MRKLILFGTVEKKSATRKAGFSVFMTRKNITVKRQKIKVRVFSRDLTVVKELENSFELKHPRRSCVE